MTIYGGYKEIPMIEIENGVLWDYLKDRFHFYKEDELTDGGFLVKLHDIKDHYCILLKNYLEFTYSEDIEYMDYLLLLLNDILSFVDNYIYDSYTVCYIIGFNES